MVNPNEMVCDFCGTNHVSWEYRTHNFTSSTTEHLPLRLTFEDDGGWVTCDRCHEFIEADDWPGLIRYIEGVWGKIIPDLPPSGPASVQWVHDTMWVNFRKNKVGCLPWPTGQR